MRSSNFRAMLDKSFVLINIKFFDRATNTLAFAGIGCCAYQLASVKRTGRLHTPNHWKVGSWDLLHQIIDFRQNFIPARHWLKWVPQGEKMRQKEELKHTTQQKLKFAYPCNNAPFFSSNNYSRLSKAILSFACCVFRIRRHIIAFFPHLFFLLQHPFSSFPFLIYLLLFPWPAPVWNANL